MSIIAIQWQGLETLINRLFLILVSLDSSVQFVSDWTQATAFYHVKDTPADQFVLLNTYQAVSNSHLEYSTTSPRIASLYGQFPLPVSLSTVVQSGNGLGDLVFEQ